VKILGIVFKAILLVLPLSAAGQETGSKAKTGNLQITSPVNGAVVNPGQTITVAVTSPTHQPFREVLIVGEGALSIRSIPSIPGQISLTIPKNISCRRYTITALGATPSGQVIDSIEVDVERSDLPTSFYTQMPTIGFENLGESLPVKIVANFSDGSSCDVTESSKLIFSSSNANVATVDATGMVTALGVGNASITATYGGHRHITIPTTVPPQALAPSPSSLDFGSQKVGISSTKQIFFTNKTYGPMKILGLSTTGDFSEKDDCQSSSPLAAGGTCTVYATFTPTQLGLRTGSVSISDGFSGTETIFLSGTATTPLR
jgi:hypothetical protein